MQQNLKDKLPKHINAKTLLDIWHFSSFLVSFVSSLVFFASISCAYRLPLFVFSKEQLLHGPNALKPVLLLNSNLDKNISPSMSYQVLAPPTLSASSSPSSLLQTRRHQVLLGNNGGPVQGSMPGHWWASFLQRQTWWMTRPVRFSSHQPPLFPHQRGLLPGGIHTLTRPVPCVQDSPVFLPVRLSGDNKDPHYFPAELPFLHVSSWTGSPWQQ